MSGTPLVVDTSVFIDHLRGVTEARDALVGARSFGRSILGSVLTRTEILGGMRSAERSRTIALLDVVDWVEVTEAIADDAGALARRYRSSHPGIDIADYVIAATTSACRAELWTRNVKHFPMFPGLTAPY